MARVIGGIGQIGRIGLANVARGGATPASPTLTAALAAQDAALAATLGVGSELTAALQAQGSSLSATLATGATMTAALAAQAASLSATLVSTILTRTQVSHPTSNTTAAQSSVTFASANIGTAASDRIVLIAVYAEADSGDIGTGNTSVTLGGSAMTLCNDGTTDAEAYNASNQGGGEGNYVGWFWLLVTTGTSADVVVDFSASGATTHAVDIEIYNVNGDVTAGVYNCAKSDSGAALSINVPAGGLYTAAGDGAAFNVIAWTGPTLDDGGWSGQQYYSAASDNTAGDAQAISATNDAAIAAVAFGPGLVTNADLLDASSADLTDASGNPLLDSTG